MMDRETMRSFLMRSSLACILFGGNLQDLFHSQNNGDSSMISGVHAFANRAPPMRLPQHTLRLKNCGGLTHPLDEDAPLALLFLDADSTFSQNQYMKFAEFAEVYPAIKFVAIESFSLGFGPNVCQKVPQPPGSPAIFLLDRHDFSQNQYAYEFFGIAPNEILLYHKRQRFRYIPKTQADMTRPIGHTWVHTALEELDRTVSTTGLNPHPLFLTSNFDEFPQAMVEDGEVGRILTAHSRERCEQHCMEIGCTALVMYGSHHCAFFAGEPSALKQSRVHYANASLLVRKPLVDVDASTKLLKGFLWAAVIIFSAVLIFVTCAKVQTRKGIAGMAAAASPSMMWQTGLSSSGGMVMTGGAEAGTSSGNTGLSSLIRAAEMGEEDGGEDERFEKVEDPAE